MKKKQKKKDEMGQVLASRGIGKKQGSPGQARKVFGQPARGLVKGYV